MTNKPETTDKQLKKCQQVQEILWHGTGICVDINSIHKAMYNLAKSAKELANTLRRLQSIGKRKRRAIVRHKK